LFLRRNPHIALGRALRPALSYALKLVLFSGVAVVPVLWVSPRLAALFGGRGRLAAYGIPLGVSLLVFMAAGVFLLVITGDKQVRAIVRMFKKRGQN
jgi:putative peptidoglycan lipid II flippase